jgi:hypothetical protein
MSNPRKRRRSRLYAEAPHRAATVKERSAGIRDCVFEMVDLVIGRKHLPARPNRRWAMGKPRKRRRSLLYAEAPHRTATVKARCAGIRDYVFEMVCLVIGRMHLPARPKRRWAMSNPRKRRRSRLFAEAPHRTATVKARCAGRRDCTFEMVCLVIGRTHLPARRRDRPSHFVVCRPGGPVKSPPARQATNAGASRILAMVGHALACPPPPAESE